MTEEDESGNPNYDPLTQIRNLWLKKGRSEQEFNELAIPLEHKILHVYPGLSTNLMRQSTAMWIQNKSEKVSHLALSREPERFAIKCLLQLSKIFLIYNHVLCQPDMFRYPRTS